MNVNCEKRIIGKRVGEGVTGFKRSLFYLFSIVALAVTFMAVKTAMAIEPPANLTAIR